MPPDARLREQDRLAALSRYAILDTPPEEAFERLTRLACRLFAVPISTVTLIDANRQWFKARRGLEECATPRGPALCDIAIRARGPLVIPDTHADARFRDNPLVTGGARLRFYAGVPLRSFDDQAIGTFCVMDRQPRRFEPEDVTALTDLAGIVTNEMELRRLAMTDALTGALSRRAFLDQAGYAFAQARRPGRMPALVAFDLDHFKSINDRHGHPVGDRVLVAATEACRRVLHAGEVLGRMGGEEFAVLLPQTDREHAVERAEHLRTALAQVRVPASAGVIGVTASFGVASLDGSAGDLDDVLQAADAALYAAKRGGRNRCATQGESRDAEARAAAGAVANAGSIAFVGTGTVRTGAIHAN